MDDEYAGIGKELSIPTPERTISIIEELKWSRRVCLFAPQQQENQADNADFTGCVGELAGCDWLIVCEPRRTAEQVHKRVVEANGGIIAGVRILVLSPTPETHHSQSLLHDPVLFPSPSLGWMTRPLPEWLPADQAAGPDKMWGHHSRLELESAGQRKPLDMLHLGLPFYAVWPLCLQSHGIRVARVIARPPW